MTQLSTKSYQVDLLLVFYMAFPKFIRLAVLSALSFHRLTPITTISLLTLFLYFSQSRPTNTLFREYPSNNAQFRGLYFIPTFERSTLYTLAKYTFNLQHSTVSFRFKYKKYTFSRFSNNKLYIMKQCLLKGLL